MVWIIFPFWLVSTLAVIFLVLLHSGRGGGLSDFMGGGGAASAAAGSTVMEKNLDRITIVCALVFGLSTILLGLYMET